MFPPIIAAQLGCGLMRGSLNLEAYGMGALIIVYGAESDMRLFGALDALQGDDGWRWTGSKALVILSIP